MYATQLHHRAACSEAQPSQRVVPQPAGVGIALYRCPECGATATTRETAKGLR